VLPEEEFPADEEQIKEEEIVFPVWGDVLAVIRQHGWRGEAEVLEEVGSAL
jgi:hypothetical protein